MAVYHGHQRVEPISDLQEHNGPENLKKHPSSDTRFKERILTLAEGASVSLMNILLRPATGLNE